MIKSASDEVHYYDISTIILAFPFSYVKVFPSAFCSVTLNARGLFSLLGGKRSEYCNGMSTVKI
jgi:hypothetical protein